MIHALIFALMVKENSKNSKKEDLACCASFSSQVNRGFACSPTIAWLRQAAGSTRKMFFFQTKLLLEERREDWSFGKCKTSIQKQLFKRPSIFFNALSRQYGSMSAPTLTQTLAQEIKVWRKLTCQRNQTEIETSRTR